MNMDEYKKYSLEQLENWVHDVMSSGLVTPEEIYDTIREVVKENYYIYKEQASKANELLSLLNGNGKEYLTCDKNDPSPECKGAWNSFWEEPKIEDIMPPWGHSDMEALRYSDEELKAMCDKAELDAEIERIRQEGGYDWTPEVTKEKYSKYYYDYTRNDINRKNPFSKDTIYESPDGGKTIYSREFGKTEKTLIKKETPKKWILPIEQSVIDGVDDYYVNFPDDLLESVNLKEGDEVEWIDNGDGTYILKKIEIAHHSV